MTYRSIKSLGSSIGGAIILGLFATTFLTIDKAVFIMPLFLGFTGAMLGFQLIESLRSRIKGGYLFPFVMGCGQGAVVFSLLNISAPLAAGTYLGLGLWDLGVYILVSGITSVLGARLALRYFNL
jgi:uncharacterized membrane protein YeaQ/YmgE (transglycosylase-associated protein family)